ncbi:MAG: Shikimate kinase [Candidatus Dichloromethanomonas elyunquensis]|nr:MAG: Shikimate kinase [Candidatus Dichloromethanomonas elyunquensis]
MYNTEKGGLKNVILIGFMASGKSSVGRVLARELGWAFLDTDSEIEQVTGLKIPDLFQKYGEVRFRSEENLMVKKLRNVSHTVIATGGGTVLSAENRELLGEMGMMIHLYAPLDVALQRVKRRQDRPLLNKSFQEIEKLWQERLTIYQQAPITIDTSVKDIEEIAGEILAIVKGGNPHDTEN